MSDKLTSDEVFDILKGSMPIALAGYLTGAVHPLGREGLEMVQAVREAAAAEERAKIVAWHRTCAPHIAHCFVAADAIEAKEHLKCVIKAG